MKHKKFIYLPRHDFSLNKNPQYLPILKELDISKEIYDLYIKPLLQSLPGIYNAKTLEDERLFTFRRFSVSSVSISEVLKYMQEEINSLQILLQDSKMYHFENSTQVPMKYPDNRSRGLCVNTYSSQNGILDLKWDGDKEIREVTLEKIINTSKIGLTYTPINKEEIRRVFNL